MRSATVVAFVCAVTFVTDAHADGAAQGPVAAASPMPVAREVVFDAANRYAEFEVLEGRKWRSICQAPCRTRVLAGATFRVSGPGVLNSQPFVVEPGSKPLGIFARAGSSDDRDGAIFLIVLGTIIAGVGGLALAVNDNLCFCGQERNDYSTAGGGFIVGIGAGTVVGAIAWIILNPKTEVKLQSSWNGRVAPGLHIGRGMELAIDGLRF
jgi:hypothetical protein